MKNWQQMKDFSYVGIKLTKAKTISEGLTRCKIQKLTRNNPVYQHLKLHQKFRKMNRCKICSFSKQHENKNKQKSVNKIQNNQASVDSVAKKCKTQVLRRKIVKKQSIYDRKIDSPTSQYMNKIFYQTPRQQISKQISHFSKVVDRFDQSLRKSKSQFFKMTKHQGNIQRYFVTEMREIQLEINEDKGLSINQVKTQQAMLRQSLQRQKSMLKKRKRKVQDMSKNVIFPFTERQTVMIVKADQLAKQNASKKLTKLITSIYDYKSSQNYSNRMKTISSIINK